MHVSDSKLNKGLVLLFLLFIHGIILTAMTCHTCGLKPSVLVAMIKSWCLFL